MPLQKSTQCFLKFKLILIIPNSLPCAVHVQIFFFNFVNVLLAPSLFPQCTVLLQALPICMQLLAIYAFYRHQLFICIYCMFMHFVDSNCLYAYTFYRHQLFVCFYFLQTLAVCMLLLAFYTFYRHLLVTHTLYRLWLNLLSFEKFHMRFYILYLFRV